MGMFSGSILSALGSLTPAMVTGSSSIVVPLGGQYRLDDGEVNGWGNVGYIDDSNVQDLGDHTATNLTRMAGGLTAHRRRRNDV